MRHSLRAHILYLENTIRSVQERLNASCLSDEEVDDLKLQLTLAESALEHYRQAYELELSVSGPEPPAQPGTEPGSSKDGERGRNGEGSKGGRGGSRSARRKKARAVWLPSQLALGKKMRLA